MITVVGIALWLTLAAAGWWLATRVQLLLNYAEDLLANAAKDRHPARNRTVAVEEPADVNPATDPIPAQDPATEPAAAAIADDWEQQRDAMVADMLAEIRGTA